MMDSATDYRFKEIQKRIDDMAAIMNEFYVAVNDHQLRLFRLENKPKDTSDE